MRGFRRSVSGDLPVAAAQEIEDERPTEEAQESSVNATAVQPGEHRAQVDRTPGFDECRVDEGHTQLALLLMLAARLAVEARDDELRHCRARC